MSKELSKDDGFGPLLKALRKAHGLSQTELAEEIGRISGQKYSKVSISNWETNKNLPSVNTAIAALDEILETGGTFTEMLGIEAPDAWRYAIEARLASLESAVSTLLKFSS
jgi:transcriptional regulator with XRE-family HTH domain